VRTIQRFLKNRKQFPTKDMTKERKAFETQSFGEIWQGDTCYFPYIKEGGVKRRTYLMCIVDDHSRLIVGAHLFYEDNAMNFQTLLKDAVTTYGIPLKLYLDHGAPYENGQLSFICAALGCLCLHAPVRDGAAKAKFERTFGTLKTSCLAGLDVEQFTSLQEFNVALAIAVRTHNLTVNSSTGVTPMERFLTSPKRTKEPQSREWLDESFMNRLTRKVKNDATVQMDKKSFDVPQQFIGQSVEIRFLPGHLEDAYIYSEGEHFPIRQTNKAENARTKRKTVSVDYSRLDGDGDGNV
jgi:transposase InsO family protein